jgi:endogenous inhibitor of DNA gyrase (YacG/DUF329 family)
MKNCLFCNKQLILNNSHRQRKFCSIQCQRDLAYNEYVLRWIEGKETGRRGSTLTSKHIRRWLSEQRGEQCWECGWKEKHPVGGNVPIEIDHIDGHFQNNRPENLRLLCPNCHSLTPTYKNRNRGRGRSARKSRYHEGKSY